MGYSGFAKRWKPRPTGASRPGGVVRTCPIFSTRPEDEITRITWTRQLAHHGTFLVTRYLGIRAFGALHGLVFSIFVLGNAAGAAALGWSFQLLHSYEPAFGLFEVLLVIACILFVTMGPYRYPATGAR
jgi:hypothetical protein